MGEKFEEFLNLILELPKLEYYSEVTNYITELEANEVDTRIENFSKLDLTS